MCVRIPNIFTTWIYFFFLRHTLHYKLNFDHRQFLFLTKNQNSQRNLIFYLIIWNSNFDHLNSSVFKNIRGKRRFLLSVLSLNFKKCVCVENFVQFNLMMVCRGEKYINKRKCALFINRNSWPCICRHRNRFRFTRTKKFIISSSYCVQGLIFFNIINMAVQVCCVYMHKLCEKNCREEARILFRILVKQYMAKYFFNLIHKQKDEDGEESY
jgi:hypothetical protein